MLFLIINIIGSAFLPVYRMGLENTECAVGGLNNSPFQLSDRDVKLTAACIASTVLAIVCPTPLSAQQTPGGPGTAPPGRRVDLSPRNQQPPSEDLLQRNYLIFITVKEGEKSTDFSLLTASSSIKLSAAGGGDNQTVVTLTGTLSELEGGKLTLRYSIGARIPVFSEGVNGNRNIEYTDQTGAGALHVTPGKAQSVMKSGDRSYSVTVTPVLVQSLLRGGEEEAK